jgi:hypothetical protein
MAGGATGEKERGSVGGPGEVEREWERRRESKRKKTLCVWAVLTY